MLQRQTQKHLRDEKSGKNKQSTSSRYLPMYLVSFPLPLVYSFNFSNFPKSFVVFLQTGSSKDLHQNYIPPSFPLCKVQTRKSIDKGISRPWEVFGLVVHVHISLSNLGMEISASLC